MTLIDTSAWIEFFRSGGDQTAKERVSELIGADEAAYTCPVFFELMAGAREKEKRTVREALSFCRREFFVERHWELAAEHENNLLSRGVTVPRDDLFVGTIALEKGLPLLCKDRHFDLMRDRGKIKLEIVQLA
jgi:predicted nucleic acid-binding protein